MTEKARSSRSSSSGRAAKSGAQAQHLLVGVVARAVGLRGEVEITVQSDATERFDPGSRFLAGPRRLTVRSRRSHFKRTVVAFEEVTDRSGAEALKGAELFIEQDQARQLEAGEYWDHQLVGCTVETVSGKEVGEVSDVLHQPSSEVLVVDTESGQRLIPLVGAFVRSVDPGRRIVVDPIPGLLD